MLAVELLSAGKVRELALTDFQLGSYETALQPGELLAAVVIPPLPQGMNGHYVKFTTGSSEERPCAGVAALARFEKGFAMNCAWRWAQCRRGHCVSLRQNLPPARR